MTDISQAVEDYTDRPMNTRAHAWSFVEAAHAAGLLTFEEWDAATDAGSDALFAAANLAIDRFNGNAPLPQAKGGAR
jgi:hypothetical protein